MFRHLLSTIAVATLLSCSATDQPRGGQIGTSSGGSGGTAPSPTGGAGGAGASGAAQATGGAGAAPLGGEGGMPAHEAGGGAAATAGGGGEGPDCDNVVGGACGTCLETQCCAELAVCADDTACLQCLSGTPSACNANSSALIDCWDPVCNDDCGAPDGGGGGAPDCTGLLVQNACGVCLETDCCAALAACFDSADCVACVFNGVTNQCGTTESDTLLTCSANACNVECGEPPPNCTNIFPSGACGDCLETSCCAESEACALDANCAACFLGDDPTACSGAAVDTLINCAEVSCTVQCNLSPPPDVGAPQCAGVAGLGVAGTCGTPQAGWTCNPITNSPCASGSACDRSVNGAGDTIFVCYSGPQNTQSVCETCDASIGPYCEGGDVCIDGSCYRYCCSDAECGAGTCAFFDATVAVGVCVVASGAGGGGGAGGGP